MRVLLIGGAGYVGSACLRWLLTHGHDPVALDNLSEGNAGAVPPDRLIRGDLLEPGVVARALADTGAEAVMHFAAAASVPESIKDPDFYYDLNVLGVKRILDAMRDQGVWRIVFSSTCATYGPPDAVPITEGTPQRPTVPYGRTKLAAEHMIRDYCRAYDLGGVMLRYFNASGADPDARHGEDRVREVHLIPLTLYVPLGRRDKLRIFGDDFPTPDGTCVRDYIHNDDLAHAHQLAMEQVRPGEARMYNVGTGNGASVKQVHAACERAVGAPIPFEIQAPRPGDPPELVASSDKIRRELGWQPRYTHIDDIVATAWAWHKAHPEGYGEHEHVF